MLLDRKNKEKEIVAISKKIKDKLFYLHLFSEEDDAPQSQSDNELQQYTCEEEMVPEILKSEIRYGIKNKKKITKLQGDPLSPKLFAATLKSVFKNLHSMESFGININGMKLNNLRFADDLVIFAEDAQTLELASQQLALESKKDLP
ncbi:unnamed protein product [Euphydryas editha]|uniref:Reverse transcriptase n=1 Tax=Euphydryas editha TaxID=104508 RepID=A0AAU9TG36_EUPED|nr:unnamed protein product [Euphydryas editha]